MSALKLYLRHDVSTQAGGPSAPIATGPADQGHVGAQRNTCLTMTEEMGPSAESRIWAVEGLQQIHLDFAAVFLSVPLAAQTFRAGGHFTIASSIKGMAGEESFGQFWLHALIYLWRPGVGWVASLSNAAAVSKGTQRAGQDFDQDPTWRVHDCNPLAADIEVRRGDRLVVELWHEFAIPNSDESMGGRYAHYWGGTQTGGDLDIVPDPASYVAYTDPIDVDDEEDDAITVYTRPDGYMGKDSPTYAVAADGTTALLDGVQDVTNTGELRIEEIVRQGLAIPDRVESVMQPVTGEIVMGKADLYHAIALGGGDPDDPVFVLADAGPIDIVRPYIDPETGIVGMTRYLRGVRLNSIGSAGGAGDLQTLRVAFTAQEALVVDGVVYVDTGTLAGWAFATRHGPLLEPDGLLRLSVMSALDQGDGILTDITDNYGIWGAAIKPSYEVQPEVGYTWLWGVTTGAYVAVYACARPAGYTIFNWRGTPHRTLPT